MNHPRVAPATWCAIGFAIAGIATLAAAGVCIDLQAELWLRNGLLLLAGAAFLLSVVSAASNF
jgi:hypothetical protein